MIIRFVLVGIEGSINLGVIARTCMNFGIDELYIVDPKANIDEALRYSAKARDYLLKSKIVSDLAEALKDSDLIVATTAKGYSVGDVLRQAIDINEFINLVKKLQSSRITVLFGRESTGLTRNELAMADYLVTITANPEYPVLNVSQAVAIVAWEFWKIRSLKAENIPPRASRDEIEKLLSIIKDISRNIFSSDDKIRRITRIWNNVIYRSYPSKYEVRLLTYWVRRVLSKLNRVIEDE